MPLIPEIHVNDGDIITAAHYNALWEALRGLGGGAPAGDGTFAFPVVLHPDDDASGNPADAWGALAGGAHGPLRSETETGEVRGWMPLDLPNGSTIESVQVRGARKEGAEGFLTASIAVYDLETRAVVIPFENKDVADEPVAGPGETFVAELARNDRKESRVDTSRFQYVFSAKLERAPSPSKFELHLVQIAYS